MIKSISALALSVALATLAFPAQAASYSNMTRSDVDEHIIGKACSTSEGTTFKWRSGYFLFSGKKHKNVKVDFDRTGDNKLTSSNGKVYTMKWLGKKKFFYHSGTKKYVRMYC